MAIHDALGRGGLLLALAVAGCTKPAATPAPSEPRAAESDAAPETAAHRRPKLMAVLRNQSYLEQLSDGARASAIWEPFLPGLVVIYMVDERGAARDAQAEDLALAGVTREALRPIVDWNLTAALSGTPNCYSNTVTRLSPASYYESSRLLLDRQWAELAAKRGTVVVAVPSNDALFVACNPKPAVLQKMNAAIQNIYPRAPRPVSPALLTWTADGWRELTPP